MKKLSFVILFFFAFSCFALAENTDSAALDSNTSDVSFEDENEDKSNTDVVKKPVKVRKQAVVRPKREHRILKEYALNSLEKNKQQFKTRKEKELELLRYEYGVLEYNFN